MGVSTLKLTLPGKATNCGAKNLSITARAFPVSGAGLVLALLAPARASRAPLKTSAAPQVVMLFIHPPLLKTVG
jgi:hypothetical protein